MISVTLPRDLFNICIIHIHHPNKTGMNIIRVENCVCQGNEVHCIYHFSTHISLLNITMETFINIGKALLTSLRKESSRKCCLGVSIKNHKTMKNFAERKKQEDGMN